MAKKKTVKKIDIKDADTLVLKSSDGTLIQQFIKTLPSAVEEKKYKIINPMSPMQLGTNVLSTVVQGSAVKALAANGLFTATVAPQTLMHYVNGSVSSIIREGGKFVAHSGFISADVAVFTPLIAVQLLSIFTSQYYLKGITNQFNQIHKSLDKIKNLNYSQDKGRLLSIEETLKQKLLNRQPTKEDLQIIDFCRKDCVEIAEKYLDLLNQLKAPEKTKHHVNEEKRFDEIMENLNQSEGEFFIGMALSSYSLSVMADTANVYALTQLNADGEYSLKLKDSIDFMNQSLDDHQVRYQKSATDFYSGYRDLINKYKSRKANHYDSNDSIKKKIDDYEKKVENNVHQISKLPAIEVKDKIMDYLTKPREILICIDENGKERILQEL